MNNTTMDDLLKPLINQGFDIREKNTIIPTFIVTHNGTEHTFEIGVNKVDISDKQPSSEGVIEYYTDCVKQLAKEIDAFDWEDK